MSAPGFPDLSHVDPEHCMNERIRSLNYVRASLRPEERYAIRFRKHKAQQKWHFSSPKVRPCWRSTAARSARQGTSLMVTTLPGLVPIIKVGEVNCTYPTIVVITILAVSRDLVVRVIQIVKITEGGPQSTCEYKFITRGA